MIERKKAVLVFTFFKTFFVLPYDEHQTTCELQTRDDEHVLIFKKKVPPKILFSGQKKISSSVPSKLMPHT